MAQECILKKPSQYANKEQQNLLVELMSQRPELRSGKFSSTFTIKDAQRQWQEIATELHKIPGAVNDWKQWKKTWQDMKTAAKAKNTSISNFTKTTGGGPASCQTLSQNEKKILSLVGSSAVEGHKEVQESLVQFEWSACDATHDLSDGEIIVDNRNEPPEISHHSPQSPSSDNTNKPPPSQKKGVKRTSAALRHETAIHQTEKLAKISEDEYDLKKWYYTKKLALFERDVEAKERIATSLEEVVNYLKQS